MWTASGAIIAASTAIDSRLTQERPVLAFTQTYRTTIIDQCYVGLPRPTVATAVAVIAPAIRIGQVSVSEALAVNGVALALDEATLVVGGTNEHITNAIPYSWMGPHLWRFTRELPPRTAIWVDGLMGWGARIQQHAEGYALGLSAGADSIAHSGDAAPQVGTALQWDRELMAVSAVEGTARDWTVSLSRALAGSERATHTTTSTLYRLVPPDDLSEACVLVAKRAADGQVNPGQGPAFDAEGEDVSTSLWRNVDPLLRRYRRPAFA